METELLSELRQELFIVRAELIQRLLQENVETWNTEMVVDFGMESATKKKYLLHTIQNDLEDVERALMKMENGTYGYCEETGEKLPHHLLKTIPTARTIHDFQFVWI